jgi:hypothetical protein
MTTAAPPKLPPPPPKSNGVGKAPPSAASPVAAPKWGKLTPKFAPPRLILNGAPGFGKTTMGAYSDSPLMVMVGGETGYETLLGSGLVPSVDAARVSSWLEFLALLDSLTSEDTRHRTLVIDTLGGLERLGHEYVCRRDFNGDWSSRGFGDYQKGYDVSLGEWQGMLARLDRLRDERGTTILFLSHPKVKEFKNPLGANFDRFVVDCDLRTTMGAMSKWCDAILFGAFRTIVDEKEGSDTGKKKGKGKGLGGVDRVLFTTNRDAYEAKNRYTMPAEIDIPDDYSAAWSVVWSAITEGAINAA